MSHDSIPTEGSATVAFDQAWISACMRVSDAAHLKLPKELHSRIEMGTALAMHHEVRCAEDGACQVRSARDDRWYTVSATTCECEGWAYAPRHLCKHILARKIWLKAKTLLQTEQALPEMPEITLVREEPVAAEPAPQGIRPEYIQYIHGKAYIRYAGLLSLAYEQGLQSIAARFISVTPDLALAEATVVLRDGRTFTEAADSTPGNVNFAVRPHFARVALTRCKARALRDALNLGGMCAVEELGETREA